MSKSPIWGGRFSKSPADAMMNLSKSVSFDHRLGVFDVRASRAHAKALFAAKLLDDDELRALEGALDDAERAFASGTFEFVSSDEDVHGALERFLTLRAGEAGAKIHAGRSRNDLTVSDLRLWVREATVQVADLVTSLQMALVSKSTEHKDLLLPGLTHLQHAQSVLLPHLLLAHAFALARDFQRLIRVHDVSGVSPLGAAALAGTTLPLDAEITAREAGFDSVFDNAADAVSDRDFALEFLFAAGVLGVHLSRLSEEIVIWTTSEFGFATLDDEFATGSSIMPQKKNPDVAELTRGKTGRLVGNLLSLLTVLKGLPLTYNRDLQEDKESVFDSADTLLLVLPALTGAIETMRFHAEATQKAAEGGFSGATDLAEALAAKGAAFRSAHEAVGNLVRRLESEGRRLADAALEDLAELDPENPAELQALLNPRRSVEIRDSHGGTSPRRIEEQLAKIVQTVESQTAWVRSKQ